MALIWQDARANAQDVLDHYWDGEYPVKVSAIARKMGIAAYKASLPPDVSGMIIKQAGQNARAYTDVSESVERRRFTLAHEVGHYVERIMLANDNDFSFTEQRSKKYDLHEFYADEFAGALLMPEKPFLQMLDEGKSLIAIASFFGVSLAAVRKRRERLTKDKTPRGDE